MLQTMRTSLKCSMAYCMVSGINNVIPRELAPVLLNRIVNVIYNQGSPMDRSPGGVVRHEIAEKNSILYNIDKVNVNLTRFSLNLSLITTKLS